MPNKVLIYEGHSKLIKKVRMKILDGPCTKILNCHMQIYLQIEKTGGASALHNTQQLLLFIYFTF